VVAAWEVEAGFGGPVSEAPQPLRKGPAFGGALGEGLLGPCANRRGLRDRPDRTAKTGLDPECCHHPFRSSRH
jgi:hypothetical protein